MKRRKIFTLLITTMLTLSVISCGNANAEGVISNAELDNAQLNNAESVISNAEGMDNSEIVISNSQSKANAESEMRNEEGKDNSQLNNSQGEISNEENKGNDNFDPNSELSITPLPTSSPLPTATPAPDSNAEGEMRNEENKDSSDDNSELSPSNSELNDDSELSIPNYELEEDPTPTPTPVPDCNHIEKIKILGWGKIEEVSIGECYYKLYYAEQECTGCGLRWTDDYSTRVSDYTHNMHKKGEDIPATCTTDGYAYGWTCDCGESDTDDATVPAYGHDYEVVQVGDRYINTTVSGGDANGYTEWHYQEKCGNNNCSEVKRDWWSTDASEAW